MKYCEKDEKRALKEFANKDRKSDAKLVKQVMKPTKRSSGRKG